VPNAPKERLSEGSHIFRIPPSNHVLHIPQNSPFVMCNRLPLLLLVGCCAILLGAAPVAAQSSNLDTVEGPGSGEKTTLTITPHALTDDISARALGVTSPSGTRWALTLIGATQADSLRLTMGGEALSIEDISRPAEGEVGPTRVYLSRKTFLTIADTPDVRLHVGDTVTPLPDQMRTEMRQIYDELV